MLLEKRNIRTQLYKGRFEDGVFLLVDAVLEGRALFRNKFRSVFNENVNVHFTLSYFLFDYRRS